MTLFFFLISCPLIAQGEKAWLGVFAFRSPFLRAETPAFRPGRKRVLSLRADVFGDDGQRSAAARGGEVGRGPQHAVVVATRHFGPGFSQPTARYALQA